MLTNSRDIVRRLERAGWVAADDDGSPVGESSQMAPCWNIASLPYKLAHIQEAVPPLPNDHGVPASKQWEINLFRSAIDGAELGVSPPEFCKRWQFSFRTAAPPRAPSLAS